MATVDQDNSPFVSHGRGGAANVTRDGQPYTDAGIVREGASNAAGSTGRGGNGNIAPSPAIKAADKRPEGTSAAAASAVIAGGSADTVPELNIREAPSNFHVGRGGEGNALYNVGAPGKGDEGKPSKIHHHEGAAQRFKEKLLGREGKP